MSADKFAGKKIGYFRYVACDALERGDVFMQVEEHQLYTAAKLALTEMCNFPELAKLPRPVEFDVACLSPGRVRFVQLNNLTDPHPHAKAALVCRFMQDSISLTEGACHGQIYHRMDAIFHPSHPLHGYFSAVTAWEVNAGLLCEEQPCGIGRPELWRKWVETKMTWEQYVAQLERIQHIHVWSEVKPDELYNIQEMMKYGRELKGKQT